MTPTPFTRIVVGYLPTEQGADARALGVDLATACDSDLLLVSVVPAVWIEQIAAQTGPAAVYSGQRERAASALRKAAEALAATPGIGHVERRLEASSSAARGLHDTAVPRHADLIVVGSSHHGPLARVLLGSVGEQLLSGEPCAVAVAPRGRAARDPGPFNTIAAAFDGSPEAHIALRTAHGLAMRTGASLHVVMVIKPPDAIPGRFVPVPGFEPLVTIERAEALQRQELAAQAALDSALRELGDHTAVEQHVLFDSDPADAILEVASAGVDLLVLGPRAYGLARRTPVRSVSAAVVRHAPCPVLVTPRVDEHGPADAT
jgi:nucleotide-binding universal stress UspA family protein